MPYSYVVHYAEIGLKGRNRPDFERQLIDNIRAQHAVRRVLRQRGRMMVESDGELDLGNVFGIAWWAKATPVEPGLDEIEREVLKTVGGRSPGNFTFAIRVTLADRVLGVSSQEMESRLGALVQAHHPLGVNLGDPDLTVFVEVTRRRAYVYTEKRPGPGGLPVGISGRLVGLFSAGVDSAVAAYLMAKRGAALDLVHFYALPSAEAAHESKVGPLLVRLKEYLPDLTVHYLPYHQFQLATLDLSHRMQRQELVVFRRFMARVAQRIALERGAGGLFSGDNLGQVASQTLENLAAVDAVLHLPNFRPVIAYDKQEIIDFSQIIDLFELAKGPYKDCCSIVARHPSTVAKLEVIEAIEHEIEIERLIGDTLDELTSVRIASDSPVPSLSS